jgi:hypothetical protein
MTATTSTSPTVGEFTQLPVAAITPAPDNPRRELGDLAAPIGGCDAARRGRGRAGRRRGPSRTRAPLRRNEGSPRGRRAAYVDGGMGDLERVLRGWATEFRSLRIEAGRARRDGNPPDVTGE